MNKSETITKLVKAVIQVTKSIESLEKSQTVGTGKNAYKGVEDRMVKDTVGKLMAENGLVIIQTNIEENSELNSWTETSQYGDQRKQLVFTKVITTYLLIHESGEFIELKGYGHGVDSQDKSAGKSTTYALKNVLLYTFLVPTANIDDSDKIHSEEVKIPNYLNNALIELETITNKEQANVIWKKYPMLQKDKTFLQKLEEKSKLWK